MNKLRAITTLILVAAIAIIAIFQNNIRGYEEIERINEWVLYYNTNEEIDDTLDYPHYIVKSGFMEKSLDEAIEEDLFNTEELDRILELIAEE